jgi:hypothetical protein
VVVERTSSTLSSTLETSEPTQQLLAVPLLALLLVSWTRSCLTALHQSSVPHPSLVASCSRWWALRGLVQVVLAGLLQVVGLLQGMRQALLSQGEQNGCGAPNRPGKHTEIPLMCVLHLAEQRSKGIPP